MKTERRHELKTNELGAFLLEVNDWFKKYSTHVTIAVVVVAAVVLGAAYVQRSRATASDSAWRSLSELNFAGDDAEASFGKLDELIAGASDRSFKLRALKRKAETAMALALMQDDGFHPEYLDKAERAFQEMRSAYPEQTPVVGLALGGLATIEECRFVVDHDPAHKEVCRQYLERLENEPRFRATPFQTGAARRLAELDAAFEVVTLAEPLPPETPAPEGQAGEEASTTTSPTEATPGDEPPPTVEPGQEEDEGSAAPPASESTESTPPPASPDPANPPE